MLPSYQRREGAEIVVGILSARSLSDAQRQQVIEDTLCGAPAAKREWPGRGMTADIADEARRIAVPVHVIVSDADWIEPEQALRSAFGDVLPNDGYTVLPGVGHLAPFEAPAKLATAIRSALSAKLRGV